MALQDGQTLLHYRLVEKIGEGGMGVVWKAVDTTLDREVAIKILPEGLGGDAERLARFEREAKLLASLNHSNIATIHGLHESGPSTGSGPAAPPEALRFIAMELVGGEDLAQRLERGALSINDALTTSQRVVEALETAHASGVIHRDLKPANIRMTPEGKIKVLDFGLAKALSPEPASGENRDPSFSPTLTSVGSVAGIILGTAAYMSPEQARGQATDQRGDVWAFGVVLYEMLSGRRLFEGKTVSDTLAAVLRAEPEWDRLPADTPRAARRLLRRCLEKEPENRLHHIADARLELREALEAGPEEAEEPLTASHAAGPVARLLPWLLAVAMAVVAAVVWIGGDETAPATTTVRPTHLHLALDSGDRISAWPGPPFDISRDGTRIAYAAGPNMRVHLRDLTEFKTIELTGTEGAQTPFFSPDGQWIAFFSSSKLRKVSVSGGVPIDLDDASASRGGSWGDDGYIYYTANTVNPVMRIPENGGTPEPITELGDDERSHRWPQALPNGRGVLFTAQFLGTRFDDSNLEVADLASGERTVVHRGGTFGRYVPSGHLVFGRDSALHVAGFDLGRLKVTAEPVPLMTAVPSSSEDGGAKFAFSETGVFLGHTGGLQTGKSRIVWIDRDGGETEILSDSDYWGGPALSPDGERLLLLGPSPGGGGTDLYIVDVDKETSNRLTFADHEEYMAQWSPDGTQIVFTSEFEGAANLQLLTPDGAASPKLLIEDEVELQSHSWTPDGRHVIYGRLEAETAWDIWALPVQGDRDPFPLIQGDSSESSGVVSPDGRWLAYVADESGRPEVYAQAFPRPHGRQQLSANGGLEPQWSADGSELFYVSDDGIYSVAVTTGGDRLRFERPTKVLNVRVNDPYVLGAYDVSRDGRRFLVARSLADTGSAAEGDRVLLILDWFDELRARIP